MNLVRAVLVALLFAATVSVPSLIGTTGPSLGAVVNAAPAAGPLLDNDDDDNGNGNWNANWNENWNENWDENWNENWNENNNGNTNDNDGDDGDDDNGNGNWNENYNDNDGHHPHPPGPPPPPPPPPPLPGVVGRCYAVGEVGAITLILDGGSATLDVVPASSFPRVSNVTLTKVDPGVLVGAPGPLLDGIVFDVRSQEGCDGNTLAELPADVNLGVAYSVPANPGRLRFALLDGGHWVDVPTVPDPNPAHPYVSTTIRRTGTYLLYQAP